MKSRFWVIVTSVLLCSLVVGTAGAVLPSGNGQTDKAHSVSVTLASDQTLAVASSGNLSVLEQNQPVYEDNTAGVAVVEHRYSGANMTSATTTTIKSGAGLLHVVNVGTCVSGATISLFDNTAGSGTSIGKITCPASTAGMSTFIFDRTFATGLTVTTSGATDVSFSYR